MEWFWQVWVLVWEHDGEPEGGLAFYWSKRPCDWLADLLVRGLAGPKMWWFISIEMQGPGAVQYTR